ncbi:MAG: hypothetical protein IVW57_17665 [Ktedonobacterales bacterium]|nr:hypothetical protein [Ktedonobacterales bacterium]
MEVRLAAFKAAFDGVYHRAQALAAAGRIEAAEAAAETALRVAHALLGDETETQPVGWLRVARLITDIERPLIVDALGVSRAGQCLARLAIALDLPEVASLGNREEIGAVIGAAIAVGAPRYNSGDVRGCCAIYWATLQTLLAAPIFRGISGYARAIAPMKALAELPPPALPFDEAGIDAFAWELRHAFDATLKTLN